MLLEQLLTELELPVEELDEPFMFWPCRRYGEFEVQGFARFLNFARLMTTFVRGSGST